MQRRFRLDRRRARAVWIACGAVLWTLSARAAAAGPPPRDWSPPVHTALEAYFDGRYQDAQRICQRVLSASRDERVRRDAALLQALCRLRMPVRADCLDGRGRLAQLARENPSLENDPECNLAYGLAQAALAETASALDSVDRAANGFAAQRLRNREREALITLAEIWMQHTEWEATPSRFAVQRPLGRAAIHTARQTQVEQVRERLASLPASAAALADVDLAWAEHCLQNAATAAQGQLLLEQLAASSSITPARNNASLRLAELYEEAGRSSDALALYDRVKQDARGDARRQAVERSEALRRPSLELDVPATARGGQIVPFTLRVRGISAVQIEVRHVDVAAWLAKPGTRGNETQLPQSGSLRAAWEFETPAPAPAGWWTSDSLKEPPALNVGIGAYVLLVRGHDTYARQHTLKRLLLVSDLTAVSVTGHDHVVVWASGTISSPQAIEGEFWMRRSFAPTRLTFNEGIARFRLPGEARAMRDKQWYCLVRNGAHLALCSGRLPPRAGDATQNRTVIMLGGPPAPATGASFYVSGLLPAPSVADTAVERGRPFELQVFDALDELLSTHPVARDAAGAFSTEIPIRPDLAGKHLRIVPRLGGQVLENRAGRLALSVPEADARRLYVRCQMPEWFTEPTPLVSGAVVAEYPWGTAPVGVRTEVHMSAWQLPNIAFNSSPRIGAALLREGRVDARGRYPFVFSVSPAEFQLSAAPLAIGVVARVRSREGWEGQADAQILLASERPYAWLTQQPDEIRVGDAVRFNVGWFEPGGLAVAGLKDVEVHHGAAPIVRLKLEPSWNGLASETWRPTEPGSYQVSTSIPVANGEPIALRKTVVVQHAEMRDPRPVPPGLRCRARFTRRDNQRGIQVVLEGHAAGPVAVVAESGDPLAAVALDAVSDGHVLFLPLPADAASSPRVLVIGSAVGETRVLASTTVAPDPDHAMQVRIEAATTELWPGTRAAVTCATDDGRTPPTGASLVLRLIDALDTGFATWQAEESRAAALTPEVGLVSSNRALAGDHKAPGRPRRRLDSSALDAVVREGKTLWSQWLAFDSPRCDVQVPLPTRPGLYRLLATAIWPDGVIDTQALVLDCRRGVRVWLDTPSRTTVGDRTLLAVRVENGGREPQEVQLRLDVGTGLVVESLRQRGLDGESLTVDAEPLTLALPAHGRVWVLAEVEAARPGDGQAVVEVATPDSRRVARADYEILPAAPVGDSNAALHVTRTVTVWQRMDQDTDAPDADNTESAQSEDGSHGAAGLMHADEFNEWLAQQRDPQRRRWSESPWSPADRLTPGQYVKVREEFTLTRGQAGAVWAQRVPATCYRVRQGGTELQTIGVPTPSRGDEIRFRIEPLGPGAYVQEYFLATVRPGSCILPPPTLHVAGEHVPLVVDSGEIRLIVVGGD